MTDYIKQEAKEFLSFDDINKEYKKYKKFNCDNNNYINEEWGKFIDRRIQGVDLLEESINYRVKPPEISYKYNISFPKEKPASPDAVHSANLPTGPSNGYTQDYTYLETLVNHARLNYYRYYEEKYNFIISEIPKIDENRLKQSKIAKENKLKQSKIAEENRLKQRDILIHKIIYLSNNYINQNEAIAIIKMFIEKEKDDTKIKNKKESCFGFLHLQQYFIKDENNLLLALQIMNKFASENSIRVEDSISVFREYMKILLNSDELFDEDNDF